MRGLHHQRGRAEGFGALAAAYDQLRPSYPAALLQWLSRNGPGAAIDVGCGTGQVASLLTNAGWSVTGVEPDPRMAAIAREHGIPVIVSPFERCGLPEDHYDLVCAGTAWHWVDPSIGYDLAARLLRPGGRLAVFRNTYAYDPHIADGIVAALVRHAPGLLQDCIPLGTATAPLMDAHALEMAARQDLFTGLEQRTFTHERRVGARDWIRELETHSPIATLDPGARERLLGELAQLAAPAGADGIRIRHETPCVAVTRR